MATKTKARVCGEKQRHEKKADAAAQLYSLMRRGAAGVDAHQTNCQDVGYPLLVLMAARVVEWPYSPQAHADQLRSRDPHRERSSTVVQGSDTSFSGLTDG